MQQSRQRRLKRSTTKTAQTVKATRWLWEFSKRVVVIMAVLYFISLIYTLAVCAFAAYTLADTMALSTLITEINNTFRVVVGGYMIKAGVENAIKIGKKQDKPDNSNEIHG